MPQRRRSQIQGKVVKSTALFRQEVLDAQSAQYLGGIRIGRDPRHGTVVAVSLLLAGALVAFAVWGQVTRNARIPGLLVSALGNLRLSAAAAGMAISAHSCFGGAKCHRLKCSTHTYQNCFARRGKSIETHFNLSPSYTKTPTSTRPSDQSGEADNRTHAEHWAEGR